MFRVGFIVFARGASRIDIREALLEIAVTYVAEAVSRRRPIPPDPLQSSYVKCRSELRADPPDDARIAKRIMRG